MTNKEIARQFQALGDLMELHGDNPFKIRSYKSAYVNLRKMDQPLIELSETELAGIKGIGKAISAKIRELADTGNMATLQKWRDKTPPGVQEMLEVKGFGPKKVRSIWKEMGIETIGELLYACNENRLIELKGFGYKTQEDLRQKLEYYLKSKDRFRYGDIEKEAEAVRNFVKSKLPEATPLEFVGQIRRRCNVVDRIELLVGTESDLEHIFDPEMLTLQQKTDQGIEATFAETLPVHLYTCAADEFGSKLFRYTATPDFMSAFLKQFPGVDFKGLASEAEVFTKVGVPYIEPELRESEWALQLALNDTLPSLLNTDDLRGVIHNHTTYSDGLHSLREMAEHVQSLGYEYFVVTDHSQAAFYANGLKEDRLRQQWAEIDELNKELAPFKIFKSIESDILNDGSLDYPDEVLEGFDMIIASVHSNLRMDEAKATERLLTAIKNPYTTMLGHPTGRLLLARQGYPIDHQLIIDTCAEYGIAIELNANPYRLDLDHTWIPYAVERGVKISINPDAHSKAGVGDVRFGVLSARKGGLTAADTFNAMNLEEFEAYLAQRRAKLLA